MATSTAHQGEIAEGNLVTTGEQWYEMSKTNVRGELKFRADILTWESLAPKVGDTHPSADWLEATNVRAERVQGTDLIEVTVAYDLLDGDENETPSDKVPGLTPTDVPPDEYSLDGAALQVPIQLHPDFATLRGSTQGKALLANGEHVDDYANFDVARGEFRPSSSYYGITHYLRPSVTVTWTKYYRTRPNATEALGSLGKLSSPPVWNAGTSDNWLVVAANCYRSGFFWVRTLVYQYDSAGWNTDVYTTA